MHPWSFRDHLVFSIGFALSRGRDLLRRLLREHALTMLATSSPSGR
jgi:hypothetical protein